MYSLMDYVNTSCQTVTQAAGVLSLDAAGYPLSAVHLASFPYRRYACNSGMNVLLNAPVVVRIATCLYFDQVQLYTSSTCCSWLCPCTGECLWNAMNDQPVGTAAVVDLTGPPLHTNAVAGSRHMLSSRCRHCHVFLRSHHARSHTALLNTCI